MKTLTQEQVDFLSEKATDEYQKNQAHWVGVPDRLEVWISGSKLCTTAVFHGASPKQCYDWMEMVFMHDFKLPAPDVVVSRNDGDEIEAFCVYEIEA